MNKTILVGRLTKDPDVRYTQGQNATAVARFTLAVDRRYKTDGGQSADFISCVAFGKTAEFIEKYFYKGVKMALDGRMQTGSYTDKDGVKRYTTDVVAESVEFAESKRTDGTQTTGEQPAGDWVSIPENVDVELPF